MGDMRICLVFVEDEKSDGDGRRNSEKGPRGEENMERRIDVERRG